MTEFVIIGTVVLLLVFDLFMACDDVEENTLSQVMIKYSHKYPVIPFAVGFLAGHWYG